MPTIACPKCQTKYQLPESALGKAVKCQKCGSTFRTKPPAAAAAPGQPVAKSPNPLARPQASPEELARLGIDGPLRRQADIFSSPPPPQRGPNPLGNFVLEDPGFANIERARQEVIQESGSANDGMASIVANPYASSAAGTKKAARKEYSEGDPNYHYGSLSIWAILTSIGMFIEALFWIVTPLLVWYSVSRLPTEVTEGNVDVEMQGMFAILIALGLTMLIMFVAWIINNIFTTVMFLVYLYKANCNVRALGATGLKTTPGMCVGWWFVPFMNAYKPLQAIVEVCKATIRPRGKGWQKLPAPSKFNTGWALYGVGWLPLAVVMFFELNPWITLGLYILGAILHLIGAVMLILVLFDIAKKQNVHALDKYGRI